MLSRFSVRRPMTVFVAVIAVIILGVVAFMGMTTDLLPSMDLPYVVVMTTYPGASPEKVEADVTKPLEQTLATTSGVVNMNSVSAENYSMIIMEFSESINMDSVMIEMSGSIDTVSASFDDLVGAPVMMKINPDSLPLMTLSVDMPGKDVYELSAYVESELIPAFERIEGVASVEAAGLIEKEIHVVLDDAKIEEINDKILLSVDEELYEAKKELDEARAELEDGKAELEKADKTDSLADASVELADAKAQLQNALNTITSLEMENTQLKSQKDALTSGIAQLEKGIADLDAAIAMMEAMAGMGGMQAPLAAGEGGDVPGNTDAPVADATPAPEATAMPEPGNPDIPVMPTMPPNMPTLEELKAQRSQLQAQLDDARIQLSTVTRELTVNEQTLAALPMSKEEIEATLATLTEQQKQLEAGQFVMTSEITKAAMQIAGGETALEQAEKEFEAARDAALEAADISGLLTAEMISNIVMAENFSMPAGYVTFENEDHLIKVGDLFGDLDELQNMLLFHVAVDGVGDVRLCDVATVEMTDNAGEEYARVNGSEGIVLTFQKQSTSSTSEVSDDINARIKELMAENDGLHITTLMDQGVYIDMVIDSVLGNLLYGGLLAIIVLALFLRDYKPTIIVALSIPISLMTAVVLMYFTDVTLNMISISGLALGVGMLVDNSIVVIENIYRLRNEGMSPARAAVKGAADMAGAIFSSTLTTVCVFMPLLFTEGLTRQIFMDMALTITYSLTASLVVALTLVPSVSVKVLANVKEKRHNVMDRFLNGYEKVLRFFLRRKPIVLIFAALLLAVSAYEAINMGTSFLPAVDSTQMTATLTAPDGVDREDELALCDEFMERVLTISDVETVGASEGGSGLLSMGSSGGGMSFYIILREDKTHSNNEVAEEIRALTSDMDCEISIQASAMDLGSLMASGIQIVIKGQNMDMLQTIAGDMASILEGIEGTAEISNGMEDAAAETRIIVDKDAAMEYGLTVAQVYQEVAKAISTENSSTTLEMDGASYPVVIIREGMGKEDLGSLILTGTRDGEEMTVRLRYIAEIVDGQGLPSISHDNQTRSITVSASIDADHNIGLVSRELEAVLEDYEVPNGYSFAISGENEMINDALADMVLMILLGIALIYLIMVAQFRSLLSPFIVLFTIPLAFTGGLLALWVTGMEISIVSMLGFVVLAGVVVNNGIVFVDCVNQLRLGGMEKGEALVQAGRLRMRPILMTTLTTVLAMATMAMGVGMGADLSQPMAVTTIGGLSYATVLTLFVVPVLYDLFQRRPMKEVDLEEDA